MFVLKHSGIQILLIPGWSNINSFELNYFILGKKKVLSYVTYLSYHVEGSFKNSRIIFTVY